MASREEGSEPLQCRTWVLKVSIHCEGCKKKVKRILRNVDGVFTCEIDSQQNKVTVTGNVEVETLIRRLLKSGKHAELWPTEKKPSKSSPNPTPKPSSNRSRVKGEEKERDKDASKSNESNDTPQEKPEKPVATTQPETDKKLAQADSAKPAEKVNTAAETNANPVEKANELSGTEAKTAEKVKEPAESSDTKEIEASTAEAKLEKEKEPAATKSETDAKPAETATKTDAWGDKKGKKAEAAATASSSVEFVMNSAAQQPVAYPEPIYSYNMVHPTPSHSYYTNPMGPTAQNFMYPGPYLQTHMYSGPIAPEYYPHYCHESYYGSILEPSSSSQSQESYDYFNDENANSCNVM